MILSIFLTGRSSRLDLLIRAGLVISLAGEVDREYLDTVNLMFIHVW